MEVLDMRRGKSGPKKRVRLCLPPATSQGTRYQDPTCPSRETEYADAECTGLHLGVSKSGRRFSQHRYRFFGRKKCLSIGEGRGRPCELANVILAATSLGSNPALQPVLLRAAPHD